MLTIIRLAEVKFDGQHGLLVKELLPVLIHLGKKLFCFIKFCYAGGSQFVCCVLLFFCMLCCVFCFKNNVVLFV